ncbi:MAG: hypothetical protein ACRDQ7_23385 [Haloechinothrix sp.]
MDDLEVPLRLHNLVLALAGRMDDSALSGSRELIARSRLDEAAELIVGTLIAGRVPVRAAERRELAVVLELTRSDAALAEELTVAEDAVEVAHQFSGEDEPDLSVAEALERVLRVLPDVRSVHAVWRTTPAGGVPGPVPQRLVLVDVGDEGSPPATAYRVDAALRQAGVRAAVEVAGAGVEWSAYHRLAYASAVPVWRVGGRATPRVQQPEPVAPQQERWPEPAEPEVEVVSEIHPRWWEVADEPAPREQAGADATVVRKPVPPPEDRTESTTEMSAEEQAQLKAALAADPQQGKQIASAQGAKPDSEQSGLAEPPEGDGPTSVPQLSDRDRVLLAQLHAELAKREQSEADQVRTNGAEWVHDRPRWSAG